VVAGVFLALVSTVVLLSFREWILLLARKKAPVLRETEPVWLPEYAVVESGRARIGGAVALAVGLARELSGEAHLDRAQQAANACHCAAIDRSAHAAEARSERQTRYLRVMEERHNSIRRCC
jgi:hypothetical protein